MVNEAIETAKNMAAEATKRANAGENARCIFGEAVFYLPGTGEALVAGHIYSYAGRDEFKISSCCEFHFDEMFGDEEEGVREEGDQKPELYSSIGLTQYGGSSSEEF